MQEGLFWALGAARSRGLRAVRGGTAESPQPQARAVVGRPSRDEVLG